MRELLNAILLFLLVAVIWAAIFDSKDRLEQISKLKEQKIELQRENDQLVIQIDSLDSLIQAIPVDTAIKIVTRIITKYEKDFQHIDNATADESFSIFTDWLSENDSIR